MLILKFPCNVVILFSWENFMFVVFHDIKEILLPSRSKMLYLADARIRNDCEVKKNHNKVRLFRSYSDLFLLKVTFIVFNGFTAIFKELFSLANKCTNICKIILINLIRQNGIPWCTLDRLFGLICFVQKLNRIRVVNLDTKIVYHIFFFIYNFISLTEFDNFKEIR